jgi:hypothetical protein
VLSRELFIESTLELQLLGPADWWILREARLEALLESPDEFTSSYDEESEWANGIGSKCSMPPPGLLLVTLRT